MDLIDYCIEFLSDIFDPSDIASAIEKMIILRPLPLFFMRSMIQLFKRVDHESTILTRHISKWLDELIKLRIWEQNTQWDGFIILVTILGKKTFPSLIKMPRIGLTKLITRKKSICKDL